MLAVSKSPSSKQTLARVASALSVVKGGGRAHWLRPALGDACLFPSLFPRSRTSSFWLITHCDSTDFHGPFTPEPAVRQRQGLRAQTAWSLSCLVSWGRKGRASSCCRFFHLFPSGLAYQYPAAPKWPWKEKAEKLSSDQACWTCFGNYIKKFETWSLDTYGHGCF